MMTIMTLRTRARATLKSSHYLQMAFTRPYHVSITDVNRRTVGQEVTARVQAPHAVSQYFFAADLSVHNRPDRPELDRPDSTEVVRALHDAGIPQDRITLIVSGSRAAKLDPFALIDFLSEFDRLRCVLVVGGSHAWDAEAVRSRSTSGALATADLKGEGGNFMTAIEAVQATKHRLGLVINQYSNFQRFSQEMQFKLAFEPQHLFTHPIPHPEAMDPQVRAYIEEMARAKKFHLTVGVINMTPNMVRGRMMSLDDVRVQPGGQDRYPMPEPTEEELRTGNLEAYNRSNALDTLHWASSSLGADPSSVYVRDQEVNRSVFQIMEGTEFDCRVIEKPAKPLPKK